MLPRVMTRSAGWPTADSLRGGTGIRVGRGGMGRRPREGNDERVDDLNGQGNNQGMGANEGVEGVNGNVEEANGGAPDFSTIIAQQLQNLLPAMLVMRYFSFGRHLDELHVTWAHLEKKRTRLRTNTKTLEDLCSQSLETASQAIHDAVTTHQVTASQHFMTASARTDSNADLEDSTYDGVEMHRNIAWDKVENLNPQSTPQVLPSFEEYTPSVTYPEKVEETLGTPIEVEPLDETQIEDLVLNTCNHDIPLSSREVPSFDKAKPQPQPLPTFPPLDISLGDKRGLEPPIKPHSPDSFRMKEVDHLTNNTSPSPHVASFHPKDKYCHYHPCISDPKRHYGFKPGLLGLSGSLGVDFSKLGMIENDWELESKEVSFLGRGLNSHVRPKEVENVRIKETHRLEHKIQQILFQHMAPSHHHGVYHYYHPHLNSSIREPTPLSVK
ncbi:hypothetical protein Tco_0259641 [Tanacetum coccineum]